MRTNAPGRVPHGARSECGRFWYDAHAADAAVGFFPRFLRLTTGEWAGKPFVLEPWEADDIIRPLFGWKRDDGTRRYRRCYVWVPRKNGKTELAAGVSHLALVGDAEPGAEVYSIATNRDQARIVFDKAVAMVAYSPPLAEYVEAFKTSIYCPQTNGSIKPLTGKAEGKHGLNPHGIIGDEIHEWANGELYQFVHQGAAARRQPIEFLISTAGKRSGYGWEVFDYCEKVLAREIDDDETLIAIYAADPDDDWADPETWRKANPNFGISVKEEFLRAECARAKESPRVENDFKRYHLNIWTEQAVRWLPMDKWGPVANRWREPQFEAELGGEECFAGVDLSTTTDLAGYCLWFPPSGGRKQWRKITRPFVPKDSIPVRSRTDRAPYDQWERIGALKATPGNVIDFDFIKASLIADASRFRIRKVAIDRFLATQIAIQLRDEGLDAVLIGQGFVSMSAPSKELERLVLAGLVDHGGHPVARWCASNAAIATDPAGNIKPDKSKSTERIDMIAADVNALAAALGEIADEIPLDQWIASMRPKAAAA